MSDATHLFNAILDNPECATARLAWADFLDERGDGDDAARVIRDAVKNRTKSPTPAE